MTGMIIPKLSRRAVLQAAGAGSVALASGGALAQTGEGAVLKGNINHSVARWTYDFLSLDQLCLLCKDIGIKAIDLCGPDDWSVLKKHGLDSSMCNGAEISLEEGWADKTYHAELTERYLRQIDLVAEAGFTNLICFSGNRRDMDPADGLANCAAGLKEILGHAEESGVVLHMELLNSKVDHPDYLCHNSVWGVELCNKLGSDNFKLLYDIYHMQIMEGDVIRTITDHHDCFGHYHTAGNPGRHEPNENQELNYSAICRAILETGFTGYIAQEFVPSIQEEPQASQSLRDAVTTCDV